MLFIRGSFSINDVVKSYREKTVLNHYSWILQYVHFATVCVPDLEQITVYNYGFFCVWCLFVMQYLVS